MAHGIANGQLCKNKQTIRDIDHIPSIYRQYVVYSDGKEIKMSIKPKQLRGLITDVLQYIDLYSEDAVELLMLTAAQESHCGTYIKQVQGPALGIYQCEPTTEDDIFANYLAFKPELKALINGLMIADYNMVSYRWDLKANLVYQTAICRIHYLRVPESLPSYKDIEAMAKYWKKYYNTEKGKGTIKEAIFNYKKYAI